MDRELVLFGINILRLTITERGVKIKLEIALTLSTCSLDLGLGRYLCCSSCLSELAEVYHEIHSFLQVLIDALNISLSLEYEHVVMNMNVLDEVVTSSSVPAFECRFIIRTSLTRFLAQSIRSSNADALDSLYLLVDTSLIHIESRKSPTAVLFDVDTGRISIHHCDILKSITLNVLARSQG
ncbi:hypothetical protein Tco_0053079 [Tanacetum coccineum]